MSQDLRFASIALAMTALLGCGARPTYQSPRSTSIPTTPEIAQQLLEVPLPGLRCRMPSTTHVDQRVHREEDGAFARTISARSEGQLGAFGVLVTEWEGGMVGDPLRAARELADSVFQTEELAERRAHRVDAPGFFAREDTGVAPNGVFVALRQFVGRDRIYVAIATVPQEPVPLRVAEAFMGSITLDPADALLPIARSGGDAQLVFMPEADFAVRMPPLTEQGASEVELGGQSVGVLTFGASAADRRLRLRVVQLPDDLPEGNILEQAISALGLGTVGAPTQASGFPGLSFTRQGDNTTIQGRAFLTSSRVYVLEIAQPATSTDTAAAREFFDSFRILM